MASKWKLYVSKKSQTQVKINHVKETEETFHRLIQNAMDFLIFCGCVYNVWMFFPNNLVQIEQIDRQL